MSILKFPELYIGGSWIREDNEQVYTFFTVTADENDLYDLLIVNPKTGHLFQLKFEIREDEKDTIIDIKGQTAAPIISHTKDSFTLLIDNKINGITFIREMNPQLVSQ